MKLYKFLNDGNSTIQNHPWSLPVKSDDGTWTPGEWMPPIEGDLVVCENGYHACREQDLIEWLNKDLYELEYSGELVEADGKVVVREARLTRKIEVWNERTQRLFACWCIRQVWHLLGDERSKNAVEVTEKYANGEATHEELAVARDAAWDAARAAQSEHLCETLGL